MAITLNLCVKNPEPYLNYHFQTFQVHPVNFPMEIDIKEVMNLSRKERKKYTKILKAFVSTTTSFLMLASRSMANTLTTQTPQLANGGLPSELLDPLMELIQLAIKGSVVLAILLLIAAGVLRMFRRKKEAVSWIEDILKGFLQILITVPIIFLLYYVVTKLLSGTFNIFLNPF